FPLKYECHLFECFRSDPIQPFEYCLFAIFLLFPCSHFSLYYLEGFPNKSIIEVLLGFKIIKAFDAENIIFQRFHKKQADLTSSFFTLNIMENIQSSLYNFFNGLNSNVLFWIGSYAILQNTLTIGTLISFNALLVYFTAPLNRLLGIQKNIQEAFVAFNRVQAIIKIDDDSDDNSEKVYITPIKIRGNITINNLFFEYKHNKPILKNINMEIHAGDRVAVVGPSGCGKTTLIQLILKYYTYEQGTILIDDNNIMDINTSCLRRKIGYVPQEIFLFSDTIMNNIIIQKTDALLEEVIDVSKKVGIHDYIEKLPDRYNTILLERGGSLSGGQRQKIALARSLIGNPDLLIFDEPTSNLDTISEHQLNIILDALQDDKKTSIIIAHRLSTIIHCTTIFVINNGMIIEQGTHTELLNKGGLYARLWKE
ncbi:peptidase domain-containing ABC transporter, partial [Hollandina sp. SP2]